MEESVWHKVLRITSSIAMLAVFTVIAYAEVYVLISSLLYEANRFLLGISFLVLLMLALQVLLTSAYLKKEPKRSCR